MSKEELKGRVIGITGAGSGMGRWLSIDLAACGAKIACMDLNAEEAQKTVDAIVEAGGEAKAYPLDVRDRAAVFATTDAIEAELGPIGSWINCAGVSRMVPFLECDEELWDLTLDVNLKGTFFCNQAAVTKMLERKSGTIINFASISGREASTWQQAYCASKFGVVGLTEAVAKEVAADGIRLNMICPGTVHTEMWDRLKYEYYRKKGFENPDDCFDHFINRVPMHRLCERKDVTNAAIFLLTEDSSYLTGQWIMLAGGDHME
ncbi:MAG: SDR family oxidoreductase [Atopobiaceae bacterium]|nr:SDR family oxidoreductase [Atopobiaceae bacterium]